MSLRKFSIGCGIACIAVITSLMSARNLSAAVVHPTLPFGSPYRIVFTTSNTYQSYNSSIPSQTRSLAWWDGIAAAEKSASSDSIIAAATFHIVGSVYDGATTHAGDVVAGMSLSDNIPVYNTNGQLVAANSADFWSANHLTGMNYDREGNVVNANYWNAWTPTLATFRPFGHGGSTFWSNNQTNVAPWAVGNTLGSANFLRAAVISAPLSAIPEPNTIVVGGLGLLGLYFVARRRQS